jgi:predicted dithiol-disulfide oxidoreductase (DUF899 family)
VLGDRDDLALSHHRIAAIPSRSAYTVGMAHEPLQRNIEYPNETPEYREARDRLLERERDLRRAMESVAAELRALPQGGAVPEDYVFDGVDEQGKPAAVRMSELFRNGDSLLLYNYMFPRNREDQRAKPARGPFALLPVEDSPCPSCTGLLDQWDAAMPHFEGLGGNLAVVARAPIEKVVAFGKDRGWKHLRLLSGAHNGFRRDYGGDDAEGNPWPVMTVFKKWPDGTIRFHWASELLYLPKDPGQDPRHLGTLEPIWTLFDLTPGGRPQADEQLQYDDCCHHDH